MSQTTILDIPLQQQEWMLRELRAGRYGHLLSLHILLLCAGGKTPTEIADFLLCSRTSVYRTVAAWHDGSLAAQWQPASEPTEAVTAAASRFSRLVLWLVNQSPRAFGWCRVRWSCAALALTIAARTGVTYSRETVRRQLHACGYVWKRAKLITRDDDPERATRLAKIRSVVERLRPDEALFWVDELDIQLLAKVGYQWMPKGTQLKIPTPGQNEKQYLAGALDYRTGELHEVIGPRKNNVLFRQLLALLEQQCGPRIKRIYVVADNYKIHKAKAVVEWLSDHPRVEILWLPSYCPQANPIERAFGDVHDKCTRNHQRKRLHWLIWDVKQHLANNGPWEYRLSKIYYEPEVEAELAKLCPKTNLRLAA